MSLTDKLSMLMARPGGDNAQKDDVPWWMRYAGRGLGTVGGFIAIVLGLLNCISIVVLNVACLIAGIWQMLAGFIVIVCEAPCCCFFIDYVQTLSDKVESRPYWNKAALYIGLSVPPFFMCFLSMSTWFGSGLIFATGIIYGMMALGKKGSIEDMRTSAANLEAGLGQPTSAPRANLVTNEQPISFTGVPARN
ncbi:calcium channel flower isoform X1 [Helicoverpa armigera]|uniref:calcium channel flower n=1 Tax=Helicoverpa zea TaxID=7113 RepID=UPI001F597478|nr:calcium channel flower [Helicoverpa zea]XP_049708392.1 calcium channel flower isoform X1 [Helicoverpa armigera]